LIAAAIVAMDGMNLPSMKMGPIASSRLGVKRNGTWWFSRKPVPKNIVN
jgi:hypothetical protein